MANSKENKIKDEVIREIFDGRLFTDDFLSERLIPLAASGEKQHRIDDDEVKRLYAKIAAIFNKTPADRELNEDETQDEIIYHILGILDWTDRVAKKNMSLSPTDLRLVPDGLLFMDEAAKQESRESQNKSNPYPFGKVVLENKKWLLPLESRQGRFSSPSMQILSYLSRASAISNKKIQWGILTNGAEWRLYYQKAQSVSEQFFAVRLNRLFADDSLFTNEKEKLACFKIFLLIFGKQAFQPATPAEYIFHQLALNEVKFYQQKITDSITSSIFDEVHETLAKNIGDKVTEAEVSNDQVKQATLKILYRILFILYAEDRDLLPVNNKTYYTYSLKKLRLRLNKEFLSPSDNSFILWESINTLCNAINNGESDFGVPKYNGGLFKNDDTPLLNTIKIGDKTIAKSLRALSYYGETYINYRNLNVEQLGSIYEKLLEVDIIRVAGKSEITTSTYDRKKSGSYYTPEELVNLVIKEATEPAYHKYIKAFEAKALALIDDEDKGDSQKGEILAKADAATAILNQKICDPAMGSGHFLVSLTDILTDQVIKAIGETETMAPEEWDYQSPLRKRIDEICKTIRENAAGKYTLNEAHLQDRHIIKRIVLKSCIYGVDKNPTAVELAKLSLWLHTFTVGAPLSFLDHHLKCGNSLFGIKIKDVEVKLKHVPVLTWHMWEIIKEAAEGMQEIADSPDSETKQVEKSEKTYGEVQTQTMPLKKIFSFMHASNWFKELISDKAEENWKQGLMNGLLDGRYGDFLKILSNPEQIPASNARREEAIELIEKVESLNETEAFFHWQIEFPEVWQYQNGESKGSFDVVGGFDAIIGNPPWDRIKLQELEWFEKRDVKVAKATTQAARKAAIAKLKQTNKALYADYEEAKKHTKVTLKVAKNAGLYQELNKGDINIYKLFVERARQLVSDDGLVSLVVPSGIASDKMSAPFFKKLAKNKQVKSFYDFQNAPTNNGSSEGKKDKLKSFFKDIGDNIKFCILTHATHAITEKVQYGCFLRNIDDIANPQKCFSMDSDDFDLVNPNTGTAPLFRTLRDKNLVTEIYYKHAILETENFSNKIQNSAWQMDFVRMLDATNDSSLFVYEDELKKKKKCHPIEDNRYKDSEGSIWLPLYKGAMFNLHDHRAAKLKLNPNNLQISRTPIPTTLEQHQDPNYLPPPLQWVKENEKTAILKQDWVIAFRNVARSIDSRSFITAILPRAAYENSCPILINKNEDKSEYLLYANFTSIVFDYIARNKIHDVNMNWFIVQQLPVIGVDVYETHQFGDKTAKHVIRDIILELVYTAHNLRGFAKDLDYVDDEGNAKPPFIWDEYRRLSLCAKLDAIYFILYGIIDNDDIEYIYGTFRILEAKEKRRDLCLNYKNALLNGDYKIFYDPLG